MTQTLEQPPTTPTAPPAVDLTAAIHQVLAASAEPLTPSKIRAALPAPFRSVSNEELSEALRRLVAANVVYQFPKYRSPQDRFWDRGMPTHIAALIRQVLAAGPLAWSELRRKLPGYAVPLAESVLVEQVTQGLLHRHPPAGKRGGDRYGVRPPEAKDYLRSELSAVFNRLQGLGFSVSQLRAGALELLHDEEWAPEPPPPAEPAPAAETPTDPLAQTPAEPLAQTPSTPPTTLEAENS